MKISFIPVFFQVSMLSGYPMTDAKFKHYQHNLFTHPAIKDRHWDNLNIFDFSNDISALFNVMIETKLFYSESIYDEEVVKELYGRKDEFDLFLIDRFLNEESKYL